MNCILHIIPIILNLLLIIVLKRSICLRNIGLYDTAVEENLVAHSWGLDKCMSAGGYHGRACPEGSCAG